MLCWGKLGRTISSGEILWRGEIFEGEDNISLNNNCGYLLFPNFWIPKKKKKKKIGFSFETSGFHLPLHPALLGVTVISLSLVVCSSARGFNCGCHRHHSIIPCEEASRCSRQRLTRRAHLSNTHLSHILQPRLYQ